MRALGVKIPSLQATSSQLVRMPGSSGAGAGRETRSAHPGEDPVIKVEPKSEVPVVKTEPIEEMPVIKTEPNYFDEDSSKYKSATASVPPPAQEDLEEKRAPLVSDLDKKIAQLRALNAAYEESVRKHGKASGVGVPSKLMYKKNMQDLARLERVKAELSDDKESAAASAPGQVPGLTPSQVVRTSPPRGPRKTASTSDGAPPPRCGESS